jgi:endonuclease/exonuclease/phosphatase family metal-dependent hydrolase
VTAYRSPTGDVTHFLNTLETAVDQLYNNTTNIILCGDFNINYLSDNKKKQTLNSLLTSYSLYSIIDFPTRTNNTTSTTIDNIFINKYKYENYKVHSLINGLRDHDA